MPKRAQSDNLNLVMTSPRGTQQVDATTAVCWCDFVPFIQAFLARCHTVVGAIAWLTHADLLGALGAVPNARVVVTNDRFSQRSLAAYQALTVRTLGKKRGRRRPLMHHKFLVGYDQAGQPVGTLLGSFNWSNHALVNLEHLVCLESPDLAAAFRAEFDRIWIHAKAIRIPRKKNPKKITCRKRKRNKSS